MCDFGHGGGVTVAVGAVVSEVDFVYGPGAHNGGECAESQPACAYVEYVILQLCDASAGVLAREIVDEGWGVVAFIVRIDLVQLRGRKGCGEDLAILAHCQVFEPGSEGKLVDDFDGEGEIGFVSWGY